MRKVESEIVREAPDIAPHLFVVPLDFDAVKRSKIDIEDHPLSAPHHDAAGNGIDVLQEFPFGSSW